jgi:hypothetical protein
MVSRQLRYSRNSIVMAAKTILGSNQRMGDGKWRNSCLIMTPGAFSGANLVFNVAADAAEMVNMSYAWLVQIIWIEGGIMALLTRWSPVFTMMMTHRTISSKTLMQLMVNGSWAIHLYQNW